MFPRLNFLEDLENLLENLPDKGLDGIGFDMTHPFPVKTADYHVCQSACCIGGWVQLCNPETKSLGIPDSLLTLAKPYANYHQCNLICYPPDNESPFWEATSKQAAKALRILRTEGIVDLERAMKPD